MSGVELLAGKIGMTVATAALFAMADHLAYIGLVLSVAVWLHGWYCRFHAARKRGATLWDAAHTVAPTDDDERASTRGPAGA